MSRGMNQVNSVPIWCRRGYEKVHRHPLLSDVLLLVRQLMHHFADDAST